MTHEGDHTLAGMVSLNDLLRARTRALEEDRSRERVLLIRIPWRSNRRATTTAD